MRAKRRLLTGLGVAAPVLVALLLLGPRVEIEMRLHTPTLPADLDAYLAAAEAGYGDVAPGTEKAIVWAGERGRRSGWAVVYLHGFSASRQETAPLAERVAAGLEANLYYARLTGHGRGGPAMLEASVDAWLNDGLEALAIGRRLGQRVVLIGVSTGATLASWLATRAEAATALAALVLISPNFAPADRAAELLTWPWGAWLAERVIGPEYHWQPHNEAHGRYWTTRYPARALLPMMGLVKLTRESPLEAIRAPLLLVYSSEDRLVSVDAMMEAYVRFGSVPKRLAPFEGSQDPDHHVLAGRILSPTTTEPLAGLILEFLAERPVDSGETAAGESGRP